MSGLGTATPKTSVPFGLGRTNRSAAVRRCDGGSFSSFVHCFFVAGKNWRLGFLLGSVTPATCGLPGLSGNFCAAACRCFGGNFSSFVHSFFVTGTSFRFGFGGGS